jgi:hypothetical protein
MAAPGNVAASGLQAGSPGGTQRQGQPAGGSPGATASAGPGGGPSGDGQASDGSNSEPPALGGGKGGRPGGGQPQDPDEPHGPNLGAGVLHAPNEKQRELPPRPPRLIGNRDWVIAIDCRADGAVLRGSGVKFAPASPSARAGDSALLQTLKQMIDRRQASVRPGEPPYRPQVRFFVHPDGLRTYDLTFPLLKPLGITMTRQNVEADPSERAAP